MTRTALALLIAATLIASCQTDSDPRAGGFIDGVTGLATGGYDAYVEKRTDRLGETQDHANVLQARAGAIAAEKAALEAELRHASDELTLLQRRLVDLRNDLTKTRRRTAAEKEKLEQANRNAATARARIESLQEEEPASVAARRDSIDNLRALIQGVAAMVNELSG